MRKSVWKSVSNFSSVSIFFLLFILPSCSSAILPSSQMSSPSMTAQKLKTPVLVTTSSLVLSISETPFSQITAPVVSREGISITLTWVYADSTRIGFEYIIHGVEVPEGYQLYCPVSAVSLRDDKGKEYEKYIWPPRTGPSDNFEIQCRQSGVNDYIVDQNYFDVPADHDQSLSLSLNIDLGGFEIYAQNGDMQEFPKNGPFVFDFVVPVAGSLTIDTNETQSKNGLEITLNRVTINPSMADVYFCITYDNHKGWYPELSLTWEGNTFKTDESSFTVMGVYNKTYSTYLSQFTNNRCYRTWFFLHYEANPGKSSSRQMLIIFDKMTINIMDAITQEDCDAATQEFQSQYPGLEFDCKADNSDPTSNKFGLNILSLPPGMDRSTAYAIIENSFKSTVEGPLTFSVNVP